MNSTGVSEPVVVVQGNDRVVVELPGRRTGRTIEQLVGQTGRLDVRAAARPTRTATDSTTSGPSRRSSRPAAAERPEPRAAVHRRSARRAPTRPTDQTGQPAVAFTLEGEGAEAVRRLHRDQRRTTTSRSCSTGPSISAPRIREPITGGHGDHHRRARGAVAVKADEQPGHDPALRLAAVPDRGAVQDTQISATLGAEFLARASSPARIGIVLVFAFMLIYYRLPGRRSRASRSSTTRSSSWRSSGSSRSR